MTKHDFVTDILREALFDEGVDFDVRSDRDDPTLFHIELMSDSSYIDLDSPYRDTVCHVSNNSQYMDLLNEDARHNQFSVMLNNVTVKEQELT